MISQQQHWQRQQHCNTTLKKHTAQVRCLRLAHLSSPSTYLPPPSLCFHKARTRWPAAPSSISHAAFVLDIDTEEKLRLPRTRLCGVTPQTDVLVNVIPSRYFAVSTRACLALTYTETSLATVAEIGPERLAMTLSLYGRRLPLCPVLLGITTTPPSIALHFLWCFGYFKIFHSCLLPPCFHTHYVLLPWLVRRWRVAL